MAISRRASMGIETERNDFRDWRACASVAGDRFASLAEPVLSSPKRQLSGNFPGGLREE